jgi:hypothetical protein
MNLRDALLAASEHGTDRLPIDADRRLRRRLGLENARASGASRRVWLRPALAVAALAAIVAVVLFQTRQSRPAHDEAAGFVDISKARWEGTVTGDAIDVHAGSPQSATVTWRRAAITAAPGTRLATSREGGLVLAHGAIRIQRTEDTPVVVAVPMGRVVIAAYRASVTTDRKSVTILLDDGSGHFIAADGQTHRLVPAVPLVSPPAASAPPTDSAEESGDPVVVPPSPKRPPGRATIAPGGLGPDGSLVPAQASGPPRATVPSESRRLDVPCTFKSDCAPGATCRKNEDGASVCMGNGLDGAACWFDSDCMSHSCTQRRCAGQP